MRLRDFLLFAAPVLVASLAGGLGAGCELLVPFETVEDGTGSGGTTATSSSTTSPGGSGGSGGTSSSSGGSTCTAACCSASDCPAPADPCAQAACVDSACTLLGIPSGGDAAVQVPGDCKRLVCQDGGPALVDDQRDVLDDGNLCTDDVCDKDGPRSNGLGKGTPCVLPGGGSGVCSDNSRCVECVADIQCSPAGLRCELNGNVCVPESCKNGVQDPGETDDDCGGPVCAPCDVNRLCLTGSDCLTGVCAGAPLRCAKEDCKDGVLNGNESDVDCGGGCPDCGPGKRCNGGGDCDGGQCTGEGGVCVPNCKDQVQDNLETDVDCGGSACEDCGAGKSCGGLDSNCLSGQCNDQGLCDPGALGTPCGGGADCQSTFCADGLCCDTACTGTCKSCSLSGQRGTCSSIPGCVP